MDREVIEVLVRKGGHPAYNEMINYPPPGVKYTEAAFLRGTGGSGGSLLHKIKKFLFTTYINIRSNPNVLPLYPKEDLIYSCGGLLIKSNKPWVTDVEHAYAIVGYRQWNKNIDIIRRKTIKLIKEQNCKILPWSHAAKKSIENLLDTKEIKEKIEILYPAIHIGEEIKRKERESCNILYVSRSFWGKGGYEVLKAFDNISKKYETTLTFLSNTPPQIKSKFQKNKKIRFVEAPIPREHVLDLYKKSDIFVFPTLFDCFGFVLLEAMAASLPIIATDIFAIPEIVINEKNGLLVKPEYQLYNGKYLFAFPTTQNLYDYAKQHLQKTLIRELEEKMIRLIENRKERLKFGNEGRKMVENGNFSINIRNKKLKEIYEELLKR